MRLRHAKKGKTLQLSVEQNMNPKTFHHRWKAKADLHTLFFVANY